MATSNGQLANQTTFNNAYPSRTVDTSVAGRIALQNVLPESGANVANPQREINGLCSFTGRALASPFDSVPTYTSSEIIGVNDPLATAIEKLDAEFSPLSGSLSARAGRTSLADATQTFTIPFSSVFNSTNYAISFVIENTVDSDPIFLQAVVTARATGSFSIKLNAPTDSANYILHWHARVDS